MHLSTARMLLSVLVLVGLVWVAWQIVASTAAYNLATNDPESALAWIPHEAIALDEVAYREFTKSGGDLNIARGFAERALRSHPLDARALSILGLIAERQGDTEGADRLMSLAGERTWRDMNTQAWLLKRNVERGDFDRALAHIDALLRTNPRLIEQTTLVLMTFTLDQQSFDALARLLGSNPPWRAGFLERLSTQMSEGARLSELYTALKESPQPPNAKELRPYLDRLVKDGRIRDAYQAWRDTLSSERKIRKSLLYNGDFSDPIDGLPFNWLLNSAQGVNIQIVGSANKDEGRALQLQFSGTRVGVFTVRQLMVLPPGHYRFTGNIRAQELRTQRGLEWRILCPDPPNHVLTRTDLVANSTPRASFSVGFTVPQRDCPHQWLSLEIPSRTASERQIEGQVWYDNLQVRQGPGGDSGRVP